MFFWVAGAISLLAAMGRVHADEDEGFEGSTVDGTIDRGELPAAASFPLPRPVPPRWLILLSAILTFVILFMAVAETTLWTHYLVDRGEYLSLVGLAFVLAIGLRLHRTGRLAASLPLMVPWLIYPVITQADQIIDNLTINQMRVVCHLILAILFAAPITVLVLAAGHFLAPRPGRPPRRRSWTAVLPGLRLMEGGRIREGAHLMILSFLMLEIWVAYEYLGKLMLLMLIGMGLIVLFHAAMPRGPSATSSWLSRESSGRRLACGVFIAAVATSFGLFVGFKNRPGAYQGSPHSFHDPSRKDAAYPIERIAAPSGRPSPAGGAVSAAADEILGNYTDALQVLFHAYHVLDRNYNHAFHNALFLRHTPVLADFRPKALGEITRARRLAEAADARLQELAPSLPREDSLGALLQELQGYVAFNLRRASLLEEMSGRFERTEAGLQHATHLYEGEGKMLGITLRQVLDKHRSVLEMPAPAALARFAQAGREIHEAYANRIVGF